MARASAAKLALGVIKSKTRVAKTLLMPTRLAIRGSSERQTFLTADSQRLPYGIKSVDSGCCRPIAISPHAYA